MALTFSYKDLNQTCYRLKKSNISIAQIRGAKWSSTELQDIAGSSILNIEEFEKNTVPVNLFRVLWDFL